MAATNQRIVLLQQVWHSVGVPLNFFIKILFPRYLDSDLQGLLISTSAILRVFVVKPVDLLDL
jgi:hypothetical protein